MDIEIICVGDELVEGLVPDQNIRILNKLLFKIGSPPFRVTLIRDNEYMLESALEQAICRSDLTILTGGLGTTPDDITRKVVAQMLGVDLEENPQAVADLQKLFDSRGLPFTEQVKLMAQFPTGARLIKNRIGQASGFILERQHHWLFVLPGVPDEVAIMAEEECLEEWKAIIGGISDYHWTLIRTFGLSEQHIAELLSKKLPAASKVGIKFRASRDGVDLLLTFREVARIAGSEFHAVRELILKELKEFIYTVGENSLEQVVGEVLTKTKSTIAVAESCTGGLISTRITDIPGSSVYFLEAAVVYSNQAKVRLIGVDPQLIQDYGAVSKEVAEAMAVGIRDHAGSSYGLAVTGIAGPGGGSDLKPVGTVFIGLAYEGGQTHKHFLLHGERREIKYKASSLALDMVRRHLLTI